MSQACLFSIIDEDLRIMEELIECSSIEETDDDVGDIPLDPTCGGFNLSIDPFINDWELGEPGIKGADVVEQAEEVHGDPGDSTGISRDALDLLELLKSELSWMGDSDVVGEVAVDNGGACSNSLLKWKELAGGTSTSVSTIFMIIYCKNKNIVKFSKKYLKMVKYEIANKLKLLKRKKLNEEIQIKIGKSCYY